MPELNVNVSGRSNSDLAHFADSVKLRKRELASLLLDQLLARPGLAQALIADIDVQAYADGIGKNRARTAERFLFRGKMRTLAEISTIIKVPRETLRSRITNGWSQERAFSPILDNRGRKKR